MRPFLAAKRSEARPVLSDLCSLSVRPSHSYSPVQSARPINSTHLVESSRIGCSEHSNIPIQLNQIGVQEMYMKNGVVGRRRMTATLSAAVMVAPNFVLVRWSTGITLSLSLFLYQIMKLFCRHTQRIISCASCVPTVILMQQITVNTVLVEQHDPRLSTLTFLFTTATTF